jgi:hypothetical protein
MTAQASELHARLIDLFGNPLTADPTQLMGNLMVSPGGRILVGTQTDDNANKLQVNGTIKSLLGGFVFPDGTTQTTAAVGRLINVQVLTSSGTYNPTPGTTSIIAELQGAGGGSAGLPANASNQAGVSGSGGAGGYVRHRMTSGFSGIPYTVGAAGVAGPSGGGVPGGTGGNTTFGGCTAYGGGGSSGAQTTAATAGFCGASGGASGGNLLNASGPVMSGSWVIISAGMILAAPTNFSLMPGAGWGGAGTGTGGSSGPVPGVPGGPGKILVYEYA